MQFLKTFQSLLGAKQVDAWTPEPNKCVDVVQAEPALIGRRGDHTSKTTSPDFLIRTLSSEPHKQLTRKRSLTKASSLAVETSALSSQDPRSMGRMMCHEPWHSGCPCEATSQCLFWPSVTTIAPTRCFWGR